MEQQLYSLSKLFTERLYRIPDYQRGYAWKEKQLKDFWGDVIQLEKDKNHYLGVLTLEQVSKEIVREWRDDYWIIDSKRYCPYYIVDGQQRLTTAIILVQSIIESVEENTSLNYNTLEEIRKKFIYDSKDRGISRSYMFGYEKDNPSYEFLKTKIFLEPSDSSEIPQETIYTHNLEFAKHFFKKMLANLTLDCKENIYRKLTQNLLFNTYIISTDIDVFVAFETMNNRGKLLSYLELLKNRLIYLSTKFNVDECDKEKLRKSINETWKSMYHYLGKNKSKPLDDDLFLSNHFMIYFENPVGVGFENEEFILDVDLINQRVYKRRPKVNYSSYLLEQKFTVKSIVGSKNDINNIYPQNEEDKETLSLQDVYSYVNNLKSCVELWYKILNPGDSDFSNEEKLWLDRLIRLSRRKEIFQATPLVMVFFQKQKKQPERIKLLKALERLHFLEVLASIRLFYVCEVLFPNMDELALQLYQGKISGEKVIKELEEISNKVLNHTQFLAYVKQEFQQDGFYKWRGIQYFLYEYDFSLQEHSKTARQKLDWIEFSSDYETIEHIYPQNARRDCWTSKFNSYTSDQRKILKHSLGNLLPLSRRKNSSFSNSCFIDKISNDDNTVGYRFGSYSENEITQYQDWTAKEILDRGIKLLNFMEKRWNIPLGDRSDKVDFLGLKFVEEQEA